MKKVNLAIIGASGMVGNTYVEVLEDRDFNFDNLYLFASARSAGTKLTVKGKEYTIEELKEDSFDRDIDIAIFAAGGGVSEKFAPIAKEKGVLVIDNSSAWRMDKDVPLVVPEVNPEDIAKNKGIISNPNCSTIQSVVPLKPLNDAFKMKRVIYSTYQSVSGSGLKGIADLRDGTTTNYPHPIADNCIPHIDDFLDNGYTKEEMKMIEETQKIFNNYDLNVTATTVRVPVTNSHAVSINIEFEKPFEMKEIFKLLEDFPGVVVEDDIDNYIYPMQINADGKDEVFVGRIRRDFSIENGINLWVVADNIRKGAATNTIQIAEEIAKTL